MLILPLVDFYRGVSNKYSLAIKGWMWVGGYNIIEVN